MSRAPSPPGTPTQVATWDDQTGDGDIEEFNDADELVVRHEWRITDQENGTGEIGEMTTFDADGNEIGRSPDPGYRS